MRGKAASAAGNLDARHSYSFIDDVGKTLAILGERDEALGKAWHVPNAEVTTTFGLRATPYRDSIKQTVAWYKVHVTEV